MDSTSGLSKSISNEDYLKRRSLLDKPRAECFAEEKLEKVKEEFIQLGNMSLSIQNLQSEITKLKEHDHKDGKIV
jgi:hypothetical protein